MMIAKILMAGLWGYLLGAVPTGVIVGRLARGVDVRQLGSGHTGGLNVARATGLWGGVLTGVVDVLLGVAAVAGSTLITESPWGAVAAGVMAVVGHNWSVFIGFGGGIGLSTLVGALLTLDPLRTLLALLGVLLLWLALTALLHLQRARSTILAMAAVGPCLWGLGFAPHAILLGVLGGVVVIVKTLPDWNRRYD